MKNKPEIAQARCGIVRECGNNACIFKMYSLGYSANPKTELDKRKNISMERSFGKGVTPKLDYVQRDEFIDIKCNSFRDR